MSIEACRTWVESFVVRHNLCPFAAAALPAIRYQLLQSRNAEAVLHALMAEIELLDKREEIQTTLLVFEDQSLSFSEYLDLYDLAEELLVQDGRPYQLASFHPNYCFADADPHDPANLSNRSPHPMIHILRWADVAHAIDSHPDTEQIPQRNIQYLRLHFS